MYKFRGAIETLPPNQDTRRDKFGSRKKERDRERRGLCICGRDGSSGEGPGFLHNPRRAFQFEHGSHHQM